MRSLLSLAALGGLFVAPAPAPACPECEKLAQLGTIAGGTGTKWSDPATWTGGKVPAAGDAVVIPEGRAVVLDVSPPQLKSVLVRGALRFDRKDLELKTGWVLVAGKGARLEIGTEADPFAHRAAIALFGTDPKENVAGAGTKFLCAMSGGTIELHGARRDAVSWTQLDAHAEPGATRLTLKDAVKWQTGDRVCVAPSGYSAYEAEEVTVTAVNGNVVSVEPALKYKHWGTLQKFEGRTLDERAEVGLLTRNVVVRGADEAAAKGFGGHVAVMAGGTAHVEGVEFFRMGQRGLQARYPIHWHLVDRTPNAGSVGKGQYAKNNSVHHSAQRAIVVHGTSDVLVEGNVAFDVWNHCYVPAEDGDEERNVFRNNLGMLVRKPAKADVAFPRDRKDHPSHQNEHKASVFWMTNANQVFEGNRAAGSDFGDGFFFDGHTPTGLKPHVITSMVFKNNVAHSNGSGSGNSHFAHYAPGNFHFGVAFEGASGGRGALTGKAVIENYTGYKNQAGAVWLEHQREIVKDSVFADHYVSAQFGSGGGSFENVVILRQSANALGEGAKGKAPYKSVGFYMENGATKVIGKDMTFVGMETTSYSGKHLLTPQQRLGVWKFVGVADPQYDK